MSNELEQKTNMPGLTSATTLSQGTGTSGIDVRTHSTFTRCGSITREKQALRIDYESFGQAHTVFISPAGLRSLTGTSQMPADVEEVREGIDGAIVISQAGKAWRSRSGRALVIRTVQSDGDLMVPWNQFKKVIENQAAKATVSRFSPSIIPPRCQQTQSSGISHGLAGGF